MHTFIDLVLQNDTKAVAVAEWQHNHGITLSSLNTVDAVFEGDIKLIFCYSISYPILVLHISQTLL